jgi:hypothetical protein
MRLARERGGAQAPAEAKNVPVKRWRSGLASGSRQLTGTARSCKHARSLFGAPLAQLAEQLTLNQ